MKLLRNKVTDAEIAEILARWTSIPVSRMLEGNVKKLLRMEQNYIDVLLVRLRL